MSDKNILLIINASEGVLQIVVGEKTNKGKVKLLVNQEWDCPKDSTEKLTPFIQKIFQQLNLPLTTIYIVGSVIGAGSFTGIRLSLCSSAALSRALNTKQCGIDFLTALAYNAPLAENIKTRVITHAKKDLVHVADFTCNNSLELIQENPTRLLSPNLVAQELCAENNTINYMLGSGLSKHSELFETIQHKTNTLFLSPHCNAVNPLVLLELANKDTKDLAYLQAEYVRSCDAVDNLDHISKKLGNNSESSHKLYEELIK